jgi:hypothetical protein
MITKDDFPDADYLRKEQNGTFTTEFLHAVRKARKEYDIGILFENGEISEKKCDEISGLLLKRNQDLSAISPHPDLSHNWRTIEVSQNGKISPNGGINSIRTRVKDILYGKAFENQKGLDGKILRDANGEKVKIEIPITPVEKNDFLYLIWFISCQCWGYGADIPDTRTRLVEFIDACTNVLSDAGLPSFYPPHVVEQSMLLSTVFAYSCKQWNKDEPLIIYNDICEALTERRASHKKDK